MSSVFPVGRGSLFTSQTSSVTEATSDEIDIDIEEPQRVTTWVEPLIIFENRTFPATPRSRNRNWRVSSRRLSWKGTSSFFFLSFFFLHSRKARYVSAFFTGALLRFADGLHSLQLVLEAPTQRQRRPDFQAPLLRGGCIRDASLASFDTRATFLFFPPL